MISPCKQIDLPDPGRCQRSADAASWPGWRPSLGPRRAGLAGAGTRRQGARQMLARRTSCEVSGRFFACYAGGYALWLAYGLSSGNVPPIVVNAVGLLCGGRGVRRICGTRPDGPPQRPSGGPSCSRLPASDEVLRAAVEHAGRVYVLPDAPDGYAAQFRAAVSDLQRFGTMTDVRKAWRNLARRIRDARVVRRLGKPGRQKAQHHLTVGPRSSAIHGSTSQRLGPAGLQRQGAGGLRAPMRHHRLEDPTRPAGSPYSSGDRWRRAQAGQGAVAQVPGTQTVRPRLPRREPGLPTARQSGTARRIRQGEQFYEHAGNPIALAAQATRRSAMSEALASARCWPR